MQPESSYQPEAARHARVVRRVGRTSNVDATKDDPELRFGCYARISSKGQKQTSIERQVEASREYVERTRGVVVKEYTDRAIPGTTMKRRRALMEMLDDVAAGVINAVVLEHVDRLSRDEADLHHMNKFFFKKYDCELHLYKTGHIAGLALSLDAGMSAEQRELMLMRTRQGLRAMAQEGLSSCSVRYGYRKDRLKPGLRWRHPERAAHVLGLFQRFVAGESTTDLALWSDTVSPTPGDCSALDLGKEVEVRARWTPQMVIAILRSAAYKGMVIYGACETQRDLVTAKVTGYVERPEDEWIVRIDEELRIVDDELWEAARARLDHRYDGNRFGLTPRTHLLTPKLRCLACGDRMRITRQNGHVCYRCANPACEDRPKPRVAWVERAVLQVVSDVVSDTGAVEDYLREFQAELVAQNQVQERAAAIAADERDELASLLEETRKPGAMPGVRPERLQAIRSQLQLQIAEADARMAELTPLPSPRLGTVAATFKDGMATMLDSLPFEIVDAPSRALADQVRRMVRVARVGRASTEPNQIHVDVEVDLGPAVGAPASGDGVSLRRQVVIDVEECVRAEVEVARGARRARLSADLARFVAEAPEAAWEQVDASFGGDAGAVRATGWVPTDLVKVTAFMCSTTTPPDDVPEDLGPSASLRLALAILVSSGAWGRIVEAWGRSTPDFLAGARLDLVEFWSRSARRSLGKAAVGPGARAAELSERAQALGDAECSARLLAVALIFGGVTRDEVLRQTSLPRVAFATWAVACSVLGPDAIALAIEAGDARISAWAADVAAATRSAPGLRALARRAPCPDLATRVDALAMLEGGTRVPALSRETGLDVKFLGRCAACSTDEALGLIGQYRWKPRAARIVTPKRFQIEAEKLAAFGLAISDAAAANAVAAVADHLRGLPAKEVSEARGISTRELAALVDVHAFLGATGLVSVALRTRVDDLAELPRAEGRRSQDVQELERAIAGQGDEAAARRMRVVVMMLQGADTKAICLATGVGGSTHKSLLRNYRQSGLAGLVNQKFPERLTVAQIEELRAAVASGVDPLFPDRQVTAPGLRRLCEERFGVRYVHQTFADLLRRLDIKLAERTRTKVSRIGRRSAATSSMASES